MNKTEDFAPQFLVNHSYSYNRILPELMLSARPHEKEFELAESIITEMPENRHTRLRRLAINLLGTRREKFEALDYAAERDESELNRTTAREWISSQPYVQSLMNYLKFHEINNGFGRKENKIDYPANAYVGWIYTREESNDMFSIFCTEKQLYNLNANPPAIHYLSTSPMCAFKIIYKANKYARWFEHISIKFIDNVPDRKSVV